MKAIVLETQQELFETSILEQSCSVQFLSYEDALKGADASGLVIGQKGLGDYAKTVSALSKTFYRNGRALLLINPPAGVDLGACLDAPASIYIKKRKASSSCTPYAPDAQSSGTRFEIWSDGIIETSLSAGTEWIDEEEKCLLLRYQPKNTSGAVFLTTLKLLSYSALTTETDREALLGSLLSWDNSEALSLPVSTTEHLSCIEPHLLTAVAVLGFAFNELDARQIAAEIPRFFDFQTDEATISTAIEQLREELGIQVSETVQDALEDYIHQNGLYAYARELKELLYEQEGPR